MIDFTAAELYAWTGQFIWPFFRIAAFIMMAPVLGDASVPTYVRLSMAFLLGVAVSPLVGDLPVVAPFSYAGMAMVLEQVLIGMALGLTMRLVFAAIQVAGEFIGLQMGLSFASFFDPSAGGNTSVMSRLMNVIAMLLFLSLNGHLMLIGGLAKTFELLPLVRAEPLSASGFGVLIEFSQVLFTGGMLLALPMLLVLLVITLSMGILNRTAQQLSVFAVGFPITLTVSLGLLVILLPRLDPVLESLFMRGMSAMSQVAKTF